MSEVSRALAAPSASAVGASNGASNGSTSAARPAPLSVHRGGEGVPARDRGNPLVFESLLHDPTLPIPKDARAVLVRDLQRPSRRRLKPLLRVLSLVSVFSIMVLKRVAPFQFRWHKAIDVLCVWFMRRFVSVDAAELLMRHFIIETNLIAFVAKNCGDTSIPVPTLRPVKLEDLGDSAVIRHDLAIYNLVIDVGTSSTADVHTRKANLDFSMLQVPPIDADAGRKRLLNLDIESALYLMNIPFCLFTTEDEYERAVNSFQLDESLLVCLAGLTGDVTFRSWTPLKFPIWLKTLRDVPRDLYFHAAVNEYAHTHLLTLSQKPTA
jgi:hypothetical protein